MSYDPPRVAPPEVVGTFVHRSWNSYERLELIAIEKNVVLKNEVGIFSVISLRDYRRDYVVAS